MNAIRKLWKDQFSYRIYSILVLLVLVKQFLDFSVLVDTGEFMNTIENLRSFIFYRDYLPSSWGHHELEKTRRTLGYPLLILTMGKSLHALIILQFFISILVPVWCKKWMNELQLPEAAFVKFLWLLILYPLQFFYSVFPMPEIFCQLLVIISMVMFMRKKWRLLALCAAALVLLKPVFMIAVFGLSAFAFFDIKKRFWLFFPGLLVLLISSFNLNYTGKFHYTSMAVENAWEYNQRAILNEVMTEEERIQYYEKQDHFLRDKSYAMRYDHMQSEVKKNTLAHWKLYLYLHAKGCIAAALDPGRYDLIAFFKIQEGRGLMSVKSKGGFWEKIRSQPTGILIYMAIFFILQAVRWLLFSFALMQNFKKYWLIAAVLLVFVGITGPVGSARYMFPFMPLLCVIAAHGWYLMRNNIEKDTPLK